MPFRINHIHVKAPDPRKTADWWVGAFGFEILSDETRVFGDRFVRCRAQEGGMLVTFSNARTGENVGAGQRVRPLRSRAFCHRHRRTSTPTSRVSKPSAPSCKRSAAGAQRRALCVPDGPHDVRLELVEPPKKPA